MTSNTESLCERESIWSQLPWFLGVQDALNDESYYLKIAEKDFGHRFVTYISLNFPHEEYKEEKPCGIAWASSRTAEGLAYGFVSMLSLGWAPRDPSHFVQHFLEDLQQRWKGIYTDANGGVEALVSRRKSR